ncbi:MAG: NADPH-dependent FMN reductase [Candidatus Thalassarchaeaceae archaeon]|jgi:FMN reductase|nr:NADPH-dependent FMN reductase [Euryarchaeota archaeon]MDP6220454.1 NADPH-dependent FMN reductase [Candidatus Thalassarchaeaceae archaeon]MDP7092335.1 NADPH-dependent FMN reductase [Candidatus Thalassarchaeaceae archaeon]MDP7256724.1 NADPH-dependent FMN reductase [Candidatus Thalassarchaeaceae archaeon]MDP7649397.1 NADPH-dependent FMN reductase [Candidatus Thalassarchaeaceae archaeon]|tara:strand:+ start:5796 stop:6341 length:546 start_codon:yes stop_codon:yes gene_type:complete
MDGHIVVMGISGSYEMESSNGRLLELVLGDCRTAGAEAFVWDNEKTPLPMVGEEGCWSHPNVKKFKDKAESADAFVLSSPEYHGTMSGVMKNNLDWLSSEQASGKVFGLMSTLGGRTNSNTLNHMRIVARWVHGWVVPEQVAIGNVESAFDESGQLIEESIRNRVSGLAESLVTSTVKLRR